MIVKFCKILLVSQLVFTFGCNQSNNGKTLDDENAEKESATKSNVEVEDELSIIFEYTEFDTGQILKGEPLEIPFPFKVTKDNILIKEITSDCDCIVNNKDTFENKKLKIGLDTLKINYDTTIEGNFLKRVWVKTETEMQQLFIRGQVLANME